MKQTTLSIRSYFKPFWFGVVSVCLLALSACETAKVVNTATNSVSYPSFSHEEAVCISGYTNDAMEPFISRSGTVLFFNSLNDSIDTSIYYATNTDYKTFAVIGKVNGVNGSAPHLDAVASLDESNRLYFISTRDYGTSFENVFTGIYSNGSVTSLEAVPGDFYIETSGWIIMDAEISRDGKTLYYVNAYYSAGSLQKASLGMAAWNADKTNFTKSTLSESTFSNINDTNYLVYAPSLSADEKELYYTRVSFSSGSMEICVSVRTNQNSSFSVPKKIDIPGYQAEAVTITASKDRIYYHKKLTATNAYQIYTMERKD